MCLQIVLPVLLCAAGTQTLAANLGLQLPGEDPQNLPYIRCQWQCAVCVLLHLCKPATIICTIVTPAALGPVQGSNFAGCGMGFSAANGEVCCAGYLQRAQLPQVYAPAPAPAQAPASSMPQEQLQAGAMPAASAGVLPTMYCRSGVTACVRLRLPEE